MLGLLMRLKSTDHDDYYYGVMIKGDSTQHSTTYNENNQIYRQHGSDCIRFYGSSCAVAGTYYFRSRTYQTNFTALF